MGELHHRLCELHQIGNDTPERMVHDVAAPGLLARGVRVMGISDAGTDYRMGRLDPPYHHVLACFGGSGRVWIDGNWTRCTAGSAYITPAGAPMGFETDGRHRWQFAWAYLSPQHWEIAQPLPYLRSIDPRQLVTAIEGLYREVAATPLDISLVDAWAQLACSHAGRIIAAGDQRDPLWQLWAKVDARLNEHWSLDKLSAESAIAPEALRRLCQRTIHRSPMRQVTDLRMRRAKMLLESTPVKIFSVAQSVGYENVFAFSAAFKRWSGKPPSECRPTSQ